MLQNSDKIILALVDDHHIVIEGLKTLLRREADIMIAGSFTLGKDFISFLKANAVHIVLLDIMLPDVNGIDLCKEIKKISPDTVVLALSNHAERSIIMQVLQSGANGYLLKNVSAEELMRCIHESLHGELAFSKEVKQIMVKPSGHELRKIPSVTKREKQILSMIAEGKTTNIMAEELNLSPLTVDTHRRNLLQKFEARNVAELMKIVIEQQLLL